MMATLESLEFTPICVAGEASVTRLRFVESVESAHGNHALQEAVAQTVGITQPSLRMDSQAKYAAVARGDAALYLRLPSPKSPDYREKIWDQAAGYLILEEAGGRITDLDGKPLDFTQGCLLLNNRGILATNGHLHSALLKGLVAVKA